MMDEYLDDEKNLKITGYVEVDGFKLPIVEDQRPLRWAAEQPNLIPCRKCGVEVITNHEQVGYDMRWDCPLVEEVYKRAVVVEPGHTTGTFDLQSTVYRCEACDYIWREWHEEVS